MHRDTQPAIPLTVIGGYLGAGKTTLLNHILNQAAGRRIAVLVNDFGAINIDARLITRHDGETISLANGCICCSLAAGFHTVLNALLERDPGPEHVIVEASGVALPDKIAQYGHMPGFRLDGVVVLVDVETIRARAHDKYVGKTVLRQLRGADLLVLTKTDLVTAELTAAVHDWLRAIAPGARIVMANHGEIPLAVVLGVDGAALDRNYGDEDGDSAEHALGYDTMVIRLSHPSDGDAFRAAIAALPEGILRGKGIVWLADTPDCQAIFQLVGKRWSIKPGGPWGGQQPATEVIFIGLPGCIDDDALAQAFAALSVEDPVGTAGRNTAGDATAIMGGPAG
ncbi:MAG: GTP-binding protein [Thermomicrobiales bacterium]